jgi:hypothetical protein
MKQTNSLAVNYTKILSTFLLIEGIWGLFSNVVFGVLTTNIAHAIIHIILGIIGLGARRDPRVYCLFVGLLLLIVGILRFVPVVGELVKELLNVNKAVAYFNVIVGLLTLIMSSLAKKTEPVAV